MVASRFDISNAAIAIFLHDVGKSYDRARGFAEFGPTEAQTAELLAYFCASCCYCAGPIQTKSVAWDYLVPVDKSALGLHAWGNVVPCCHPCAKDRRQKTWRELLHLKSELNDFSARATLIESFAASKRYDLNLNLHPYADNLYEDVGAIAMTVIQLRFKQAEQKIRAALGGTHAQRRIGDRRVKLASKATQD
jgi:hypothetical protein